jgi:hypothetical protein
MRNTLFTNRGREANDSLSLILIRQTHSLQPVCIGVMFVFMVSTLGVAVLVLNECIFFLNYSVVSNLEDKVLSICHNY